MNQNKRARLNRFEDYGNEMWDNYEVDTFEEDMVTIYRYGVKKINELI